MKEINKIICIGANCISLDFSKTLGIREKGPVDNFAGFNIWNSPLLFNNEFKKIMFKDNYTVRQATPFELQKYFFNVSVNSSLNYSTHSPRILKGVISMFQGSSLFQSSAV